MTLLHDSLFVLCVFFNTYIYRGYYMPLRGYNFYLRMFNSTRLLHSLKQWEWEDLSCNHNDGDLCTCEDNMLFSRVKIWSFHAKAPLVFHWCLYNKYIYFKFYRCLVSSVGRALVCCADVNTQGRKITEENVPPLWLYLQHI